MARLKRMSKLLYWEGSSSQMHRSLQIQSKNGSANTLVKNMAQLQDSFTAAQIAYNKARPADTKIQHRYTNQSNIVEQFLQEIETRKQHEAAFASELDIHKDVEALKQQLELPPQKEANAEPVKTEIQLLIETINSIKAQMNNNKEH